MSNKTLELTQEDISEMVDALVKVAQEDGAELSPEYVEEFIKSELTPVDHEKSANVNSAATGAAAKAAKQVISPLWGVAEKSIVEYTSKAASGAAMGLGFMGANALVRKMKGGSKRREFQDALALAIKHTPILKQANRGKVERFAETVFRFAPNVATDVNLLSSVLANAIHGESMDPQTVKSLTELEAKFNQYSGFKPKDVSL